MATINPQELEYRKMLINLDKLITPRELSAMKFQSKTVGIGDRNLDRIQGSLDLWAKLEERGVLGICNLTFLKELLTACTDNRRDVLDVVAQFEKYRHVDAISSEGQEDLSKEIRFLVDNLGRDWKFFMRALGLKEATLELCAETHPRNVREQMHMAFKEWKMESSPKKADVLRALKEIRRNDLHHALVNGQV